MADGCPTADEGLEPTVDAAYLLFSLLCPLSMVALLGWWFWSMRKPGGGGGAAAAPVRTPAEEGELARMRAELDQRRADLPRR